MALRTLLVHTHDLERELPILVQRARRHVRLDGPRHAPLVEESLATLLDRMLLSMSLGRPVALAAWSEREVQRLGSVAAAELLTAARLAILEAAKTRPLNHIRFRSALDTLCEGIEHALLDARGREEEAESLRATAATHASQAFQAMLREWDPEVEQHCQATAEWSLRLAPALELSASSADFIALCARLHDIGKVAVAPEILHKPGPLDEAEWERMREHPAAGARILNQVPSLQRCAIVVRAHHERFDGTGYPDGLRGTGIPFESRVIAVADAFHAMISERVYREAVAPRRALAILVEGRGSQWDPAVVDAMLAVVGASTLHLKASEHPEESALAQ